MTKQSTQQRRRFRAARAHPAMQRVFLQGLCFQRQPIGISIRAVLSALFAWLLVCWAYVPILHQSAVTPSWKPLPQATETVMARVVAPVIRAANLAHPVELRVLPDWYRSTPAATNTVDNRHYLFLSQTWLDRLATLDHPPMWDKVVMAMAAHEIGHLIAHEEADAGKAPLPGPPFAGDVADFLMLLLVVAVPTIWGWQRWAMCWSLYAAAFMFWMVLDHSPESAKHASGAMAGRLGSIILICSYYFTVGKIGWRSLATYLAPCALMFSASLTFGVWFASQEQLAELDADHRGEQLLRQMRVDVTMADSLCYFEEKSVYGALDHFTQYVNQPWNDHPSMRERLAHLNYPLNLCLEYGRDV